MVTDAIMDIVPPTNAATGHLAVFEFGIDLLLKRVTIQKATNLAARTVLALSSPASLRQP
jgi:hypothetical protein